MKTPYENGIFGWHFWVAFLAKCGRKMRKKNEKKK